MLIRIRSNELHVTMKLWQLDWDVFSYVQFLHVCSCDHTYRTNVKNFIKKINSISIFKTYTYATHVSLYLFKYNTQNQFFKNAIIFNVFSFASNPCFGKSTSITICASSFLFSKINLFIKEFKMVSLITIFSVSIL